MLLDHHRAKIVHPQVVAQNIAAFPDTTTALCHGVFDVVHPGHLRHLLYAKSKADVLICSVTSDRCADRKGPYRPHVPQDLRAASLALLDIVDFVVVNDAPDPVDLIKLLKPDFYVKGFEYSPGERPRTLPETAAVESYGGQVLFSPGDVVYSSSEMINAAAPDLRWDKLAALMHRATLSFDDLRNIVWRMKDQPVHVVGDLIVDRVTHCEVIGVSGKTPTLALRRGKSEAFVGGAGIVAKHAKAAGADVWLSTILGADTTGQFAIADLEHFGVHLDVQLTIRPTTEKEVFAVADHRVLKVDVVDSTPIPDTLVEFLTESLNRMLARAVIFSDFRHGIFNPRSIPVLTAAIPKKCLRIADSQVASRWGNIADFKGFDLITPNEREARFALGDQDSGVRPLAARLFEEAQCTWLLMKLGPRGCIGFEGADSFVLDAFSGQVTDPVGAGDAFLAYSTLSLLVRPQLAPAAILGSLAAAAACERDGNVPVAAEQVMDKINVAEKEIG